MVGCRAQWRCVCGRFRRWKSVVLHDPQRKGTASRDVFANHLNLPFGIAFHDDYVYVANTNEVLRSLL